MEQIDKTNMAISAPQWAISNTTFSFILAFTLTNRGVQAITPIISIMAFCSRLHTNIPSLNTFPLSPNIDFIYTNASVRELLRNTTQPIITKNIV